MREYRQLIWGIYTICHLLQLDGVDVYITIESQVMVQSSYVILRVRTVNCVD